MAEDTWLETLESWTEYVGETWTEYFYGPSPAETIRRASGSIRAAVLKLARERKKTSAHEQQLFASTKGLEKTARSFADLRPGLLAIANARRSGARIDKLTLKMRSLQQQLVETEAQTTTSQVMHSVTHALAQASAMTGGFAAVQHTLRNYEKQKALLEMTAESFEQLDEEEEDEEMADELLTQIAHEANLKLTFELPEAFTAVNVREEVPEMEELMERLDQLRKT